MGLKKVDPGIPDEIDNAVLETDGSG